MMKIQEAGARLKGLIDRFSLLGRELLRRTIKIDHQPTPIIRVTDDVTVVQEVLDRLPALVLAAAAWDRSSVAIFKSIAGEYRHPDDLQYSHDISDWLSWEPVRIIIFTCLAAGLSVKNFYIYDCVDQSFWFETVIYWPKPNLEL